MVNLDKALRNRRGTEIYKGRSSGAFFFVSFFSYSACVPPSSLSVLYTCLTALATFDHPFSPPSTAGPTWPNITTMSEDSIKASFPSMADEKGLSRSQTRTDNGVGEIQDLSQLGYKPEMTRNRSMLTLLFQSLAIAAIRR